MGQRSQIVLIVEGVKYGNDNPNDNNGTIYIAHNQWRFGANAVYVLRHSLEKLKVLMKEDIYETGEYFLSRIDHVMNECVRYAENRDIKHSFSQSHSFEEATKEYYESNKKKVDILNFLNHYTDNNNGWFFIKIKRDKSVEIGILNGYEEGDIKQRTPKEYCELFGKLDKEDKENFKELEQYKVLDIFKESKNFFNRIKKDFEEVEK